MTADLAAEILAFFDRRAIAHTNRLAAARGRAPISREHAEVAGAVLAGREVESRYGVTLRDVARAVAAGE